MIVLNSVIFFVNGAKESWSREQTKIIWYVSGIRIMEQNEIIIWGYYCQHGQSSRSARPFYQWDLIGFLCEWQASNIMGQTILIGSADED